MTFRQTIDEILAAFKAQSRVLGVEPDNIKRGRVGKMPEQTPFILIFAQPLDSDYGDAKVMAVNIFCGISHEDYSEAIIQSYELCERCLQNLPRAAAKSIKDNKITFDAVYSDYSVSNLELLIYYQEGVYESQTA